jgi:hypothetical protein
VEAFLSILVFIFIKMMVKYVDTTQHTLLVKGTKKRKKVAPPAKLSSSFLSSKI